MNIGARHLMKKSPRWISQLDKDHLFEKLPSDLYRLWSGNLVAHELCDSVLFKRSILEARYRFYGNKEFSDIVYENSRKARDPLLAYQAIRR